MVKMSNRISVVVVSSGKPEYLRTCLTSLYLQSHPVSEIIVVVNCLFPQKTKFIQEEFQDKTTTRFITLKENLYYCQALNIGIKESNGEFILCLNDDAYLDKYFIQKAIFGFSVSKRIGMVSGKILRPDGKTIDSAGLFLSVWRTPKERGYGEPDKGQFENSGFIFGVNGAVAFYLRQMLEEVKIKDVYFDPSFRIFYEDLDIAWRAQKKNWQAYYVPEAIAFHIRGATVRNPAGINQRFALRFLPESLVVDLIKNRYLTIIRNETLFNLLTHLVTILFYDVIMWSSILYYKPVCLKLFLREIPVLKQAIKERLKRWQRCPRYQ